MPLIKNAIPYNWISNIWGKCTRVDLQFDWLKSAVYRSWTHLYDCNLDEMRYPLSTYSNLSEFFLRPLKDGVRAVDSKSPGVIVSPVDAKVLHVSTSSSNEPIMIEQVKGVTYMLEEFIGALAYLKTRVENDEKRCLQTVVLYLAPGDYHHFHSPVDWTISQRRHFPGTLLPVRPWAVEQIPGLYCMNERVVLNGSWAGGFFSLGAVGALNVGSIDIVFDKDLKTNQKSWFPFLKEKMKSFQRMYPIPVNASRGQPVGSFNLGSTIVLVFETSPKWIFNVSPGDVVKVGQRIGSDQPDLPALPCVSCPPWPFEV